MLSTAYQQVPAVDHDAITMPFPSEETYTDTSPTAATAPLSKVMLGWSPCRTLAVRPPYVCWLWLSTVLAEVRPVLRFDCAALSSALALTPRNVGMAMVSRMAKIEEDHHELDEGEAGIGQGAFLRTFTLYVETFRTGDSIRVLRTFSVPSMRAP